MASFESAVLWDVQRDVRAKLDELGFYGEQLDSMTEAVVATVEPMLRRLFDDNDRLIGELMRLYDLLPAAYKLGDGYYPGLLRAVQAATLRNREISEKREQNNALIAAGQWPDQ